jgi:hypothetical protein
VVFATIPMANVNYSVNGIGSTVLWDDAKAQQVFNAFRTDSPLVKPAPTAPSTTTAGAPTVPPSQISLVVLNGAGVAGLAGRASNDLQQLGFVLAGPAANAATTGGSQTVVKYDPNWNESLKTVLAALPGATAVAVPGQGKVFKVVVGSSYSGAKAVTVTAAATATATSSAPVQTTSAADNNPCKS